MLGRSAERLHGVSGSHSGDTCRVQRPGTHGRFDGAYDVARTGVSKKRFCTFHDVDNTHIRIGNGQLRAYPFYRCARGRHSAAHVFLGPCKTGETFRSVLAREVLVAAAKGGLMAVTSS